MTDQITIRVKRNEYPILKEYLDYYTNLAKVSKREFSYTIKKLPPPWWKSTTWQVTLQVTLQGEDRFISAALRDIYRDF